MAAVGTLSDEALKRKERLRAMRDKHAASKENPESEMDTDRSGEKERLPK